MEIEYNELMKGNLIYFPFIKENVEVIGINALYGVNEPYFNKLSVMEGINLYYEPIDVFKPIQLTEEWLIKFGKKADNSDLFGGHIIQIPNGNGLRVKDNKWNSQHLQTKLDYVHQLQNLYYALTGEQLKIKP